MKQCFDISRVGKEIRQLRMEQGLTQKELFHGIGSQSAISKIENGDSEMLAKTLFLIANRLDVEMNYFYQIAGMEHYDYHSTIIKEMNIARKKKDYKKLTKLVKTAKSSPCFQSTLDNHQFLLWHEGLFTYFENHHYEKSLQLLNEALQISKRDGVRYREKEIQILVSIANVQMHKGEQQEAYQCYQLCLKSINKLTTLRDHQLKTEVFYELAKAKLEEQKYDDCIHYCELGLDWCVEHDSLYLLKHFLHFINLSYEKLGDNVNAARFENIVWFLMEL